MKVPTPEKMTSGNWFIRMRLGGENINITAATKTECIRQAQLVKAEYKAGKREPVKNGTLTLDQTIDKYIDSRRGVLSPSTIRGYETIKRSRFSGVMNKPVQNVDNWQKILSEEAALCSAKTLTNAWRFVVSALRYSGQPIPNVTLPQIPVNERPYLEAVQIPIFLDAVKDEKCEIAALLALHSLRRSELCAVKKSDIDFDRQIIRVHGSIIQGADQKFSEKLTNKNRASDRAVPIMYKRLYDLLRERPEGMVVDIYPGSIGKQINRVCERAGLPKVGVHGLRHSFASLAHHLGMRELEVMRIGGWSDYGTMRKIYTHLDKKDLESASQKMKEFFGNAK